MTESKGFRVAMGVANVSYWLMWFVVALPLLICGAGILWVIF